MLLPANRIVIVLSMLILIVARVNADAEPQAQAQTSPPEQSAWDVAALVGFFSARAPEPRTRGYQNAWLQTGVGGAVVGRYLTPHVKLEIEGSVTGEGNQYIQPEVVVPGYPGLYPVSAEAYTSVKSIAATLVWQFFENEWIHPFVQAGVTADHDRRRVESYSQQYYVGDPLRGGERLDVSGVNEGPSTTTSARAVVGGGVKMYVSPRVFVRADGRASFGASRQHALVRLGFGVDFNRLF